MKRKPFDRKEALKLYKMGLSDPQIADALDCDKQNVSRWRRISGLPSNFPQGGQKKEFRPVKKPEASDNMCSYEHCNGCVYWDPFMNGCDYYAVHGVGHRRPCKAGKGCTVKEPGKRKPARPAEVWRNYRKEKHHADY